MNEEEQSKKMSKLVAKCWADEGFKQKVLADPAATLRAEGVELPVSFFRTTSAYIQMDVVGRSTGWASPSSAMILLKLSPG